MAESKQPSVQQRVSPLLLKALQEAASPFLLSDLIRIAAEYASSRGAEFDERCLQVPPGTHRYTRRDEGVPPSPSLWPTIEVGDCHQFCGSSAKRRSDRQRWSVRVTNAEDLSVGFGISAMTVEQAQALSQRFAPSNALGHAADASQDDPHGIWWSNDRADFVQNGKDLTQSFEAIDIHAAIRAARSLADSKAPTPIAHFCTAGEGDTGLELHFEVDLTAETLRLQFNHARQTLRRAAKRIPRRCGSNRTIETATQPPAAPLIGAGKRAAAWSAACCLSSVIQTAGHTGTTREAVRRVLRTAETAPAAQFQ
jgi:hypothetical protein